MSGRAVIGLGLIQEPKDLRSSKCLAPLILTLKGGYIEPAINRKAVELFAGASCVPFFG